MKNFLIHAIKEANKKRNNVLCLIVCVVLVAVGIPVALSTVAADIPEVVICNDDFDRSDSAAVGNGWVDIPAGNSRIYDNALLLKTVSMQDVSHNRIERSQTEASLNQKVSIEITMDDLIAGKRPGIWLRSQSNGIDDAAGYFFTWEGNGSGSGSYMRIYKKVSSDSDFVKVSEALYNINFTNGSWTGKIRFDIEATGAFPTKFNAKAYSESLDWEAYYDLRSDSTTELQKAGTVGLSAYAVSGENSEMQFDSFKYSSTDLKHEIIVLHDDFNRANSNTPGNNWVKPHTSASYAIEDNKLLMTAGRSYTQAAYRLHRPYSEAEINQTVAITVSAAEMTALKYPVLWLRLQENETATRAVGYYFTFSNNNIAIGKTLSTDDTENNLITIKSDWFSPDLSQYNSIRFEFSTVSNGLGSTTLTVNAYCDLISGNDWVKTVTCTDDTAELQNTGTVGISGYQINSEADTHFLMDDFTYTTSTDATMLYETVQHAEAFIKGEYTQDSIDIINNKIDAANTVIKKGKKATQTEIDGALTSLKAAMDNAVSLPQIGEIRINGNEPKTAAKNSYNITVGKETETLIFSVTPKSPEDTVTVIRDSTDKEGLTQDFKAEFSENYTVTVTSATILNAKSTYRVTVYRSDSTFVEFTDEFNRENGTVGNGWIEESEGVASIDDGSLNLTCGGVSNNDNAYNHRVIRPYNESLEDQYVLVDIPVEAFENGVMPNFWLRLQEDDDNDPFNNEGYYVQINSRSGIYINKRYKDEDGKMVNKLLYSKMWMPTLVLYEDYIRFELVIRGGEEATEIRVRNYSNVPSQGGWAWRISEGCKDTENPITNAGTVGISYIASNSDCKIPYFYYSPYVVPEYMIHSKGMNTMGYFGQWLDLDPNESYVYSYDISCVNEEAETGVMPILQYANSSSEFYDFFYFTEQKRDYVNKTFTGVFKVPDDAVKLLDGKVAVRLGFITGINGSEAYLHNMTVYKKNDSAKTNIIQNADYSKGLYGWQVTGSSFTPIVSESAMSSGTGDIVLEKYDPNLFAPDESAKRENLYENYKGEYMWYSNGLYASSEFGQYLNLVPGETYIFSYYYNYIVNDWIQPQAKYTVGDTGAWSSLLFNYKLTDPDNCTITCEFTVPKNTKLNPDGTTPVKVQIVSGNAGSQAYFYKPQVYIKSDASKTNMLYNSDFRRGLEGWMVRGSATWTISAADTYIAPIYGEIELMPVELSYFGLGDGSDDGEWWREFYPDGLPGSKNVSNTDTSKDNESDIGNSIVDIDKGSDINLGLDTDKDSVRNSDDNSDKPSSNKVKKAESKSDKSSVNIAAIIGISAGVLLLATAGIILFIYKKRKNK